MTAAKRKLSIPSLSERIEALKEEADAALAHLAEIHRPKGVGAVPAQTIRWMWENKARNVFDAYLIASREFNA